MSASTGETPTGPFLPGPLSKTQFEALNRIVNAYLEFAELQALQQRPMYMADWIHKLDGFLHLSEHDVLTHSGSISRHQAIARAEHEYERYIAQQRSLPSPADHHFDQAVRQIRRVEASRAAEDTSDPPSTRPEPEDPAS